MNDACLCRTPWGGDDCTQIAGNQPSGADQDDSAVLYGAEGPDSDDSAPDPSVQPAEMTRQSERRRDNSDLQRAAPARGFLALKPPSRVMPLLSTTVAGSDAKDSDSAEDAVSEAEAPLHHSEVGQDSSYLERVASSHGALAAHSSSRAIQAVQMPAISALDKEENTPVLHWISPGQSSDGASTSTNADSILAVSSSQGSSLRERRVPAQQPSWISTSGRTQANEARSLRSKVQRAIEDMNQARHQTESAEERALGLAQEQGDRGHVLKQVDGLDRESGRSSEGTARHFLGDYAHLLPSSGLPHFRKQHPVSLEQLSEDMAEMKNAEATEMEELRMDMSRLLGATGLASAHRHRVADSDTATTTSTMIDTDTNLWQKIAIFVPLAVIIALIGVSVHFCGHFIYHHTDRYGYCAGFTFTVVAYTSWVIVCLTGLVDEYVKLACLCVYIAFIAILFLWLLFKLLERCCFSSSSTPYAIGSAAFKRFNTMASKVRWLSDATKKEFKLMQNRGADYDSSDESDSEENDGIDIKVTIFEATHLRKGSDWFGKADVYTSFVVSGRPKCGALHTKTSKPHKDKEGDHGREVHWDLDGKPAHGILRNVRCGDSLKFKLWDKDSVSDDLLGRAVGGKKGPGFTIGHNRWVKLLNGNKLGREKEWLKDGNWVPPPSLPEFIPLDATVRYSNKLTLNGQYCKSGAYLKIMIEKAKPEDYYPPKTANKDEKRIPKHHNVRDRDEEELLQELALGEHKGLLGNLNCCSGPASPDHSFK